MKIHEIDKNYWQHVGFHGINQMFAFLSDMQMRTLTSSKRFNLILATANSRRLPPQGTMLIKWFDVQLFFVRLNFCCFSFLLFCRLLPYLKDLYGNEWRNKLPKRPPVMPVTFLPSARSVLCCVRVGVLAGARARACVCVGVHACVGVRARTVSKCPVCVKISITTPTSFHFRCISGH